MSKPILTEKELQFRSLFEHTRQPLYTFLIKLTGETPLASDIMQHCYIKLWEHFDRIHSTEVILPLLKKYGRNAWIDHLRRKAREQNNMAGYQYVRQQDTHTENRALHRELKYFLEETIDMMPPRRQTIYRLIKEEDLSYKEVSLRLGISVSTIETQMNSAIKFIRKRLADTGIMPDSYRHYVLILLLIEGLSA